MARVTFQGLRDYELLLSKLESGSEEIAGRAVYEGAAVVADEVRSAIQGLPEITGYGTAENPLPGGVTKRQKNGLLKGFGISKLKNDNGYINVKLGFDGYNGTPTPTWSYGPPNVMVAYGTESGTTWKRKHPFIRPAVNRSKKAAEAKMAEVLDEEITKIMDGAG